MPNVSPKEVFCAFENDIIVANLASPRTVDNIQNNRNVCISFIDILVQKGFQIKGQAEIINEEHIQFEVMKRQLEKLTQGKFPIQHHHGYRTKISQTNRCRLATYCIQKQLLKPH